MALLIANIGNVHRRRVLTWVFPHWSTCPIMSSQKNNHRENFLPFPNVGKLWRSEEGGGVWEGENPAKSLGFAKKEKLPSPVAQERFSCSFNLMSRLWKERTRINNDTKVSPTPGHYRTLLFTLYLLSRVNWEQEDETGRQAYLGTHLQLNSWCSAIPEDLVFPNYHSD